MKALEALGKSKKLQSSSGSLEADGVLTKAAAGSNGVKEEKESTGKKGFMSKITSWGSLKSKKTKPSAVNPAAQAPPALSISKDEKELEKAFKVYDADGDGKVSTAELRSVLSSLGGAISDRDLQELMNQVDSDDDGFISLPEFIQFHKSGQSATGNQASSEEDHCRAAFQTFDADGDGRISVKELHAVLVNLGEKGQTLHDCRQMISSVDKNGDGHVDFAEFQVLMGTKSGE